MAKDKDSEDKETPPTAPASAPVNNQFNSKDIVSNTINNIFHGNNRYLQNTKVHISHTKSKNKQVASNEVKLALTVLLVELASADGSFEMPEYNSICLGLKQVFNIDRSEMQRLINQASTVLAGPRGTSHFAETLSKSLSDDQKKEVIDIIDELISADGRVDGFEVYLRQKYLRLLGVSEEVKE